MPIIEVVWRHLLEQARQGHRQWGTTAALAHELGLATSTVHRSLTRPVEIGAVRITRQAGIEVLDPYRLLVLFAAHHRIPASPHQPTTTTSAPATVEAVLLDQGVTLGGFSALIHHTIGINRIADYTSILAYTDQPITIDSHTPSDGPPTTIQWVPRDRWIPESSTYTTVAHAWADLFATPGWQAARFIHETDPRTVTEHAEPVLLI